MPDGSRAQRRQQEKESQQRQARFGEIQTRGNPYRWTADLYHRTLRTRWRVIIPLAIAFYLLINLAFAALYCIGDEQHINGAEEGSLLDAFFFSVQTLSTIGYGGMTPNTRWANILVTVQAFTGIALTALSTGLAFAKFARPTAKIVFSQKAVIYQRNGQPCFSFRAANSRGTDIVEAQMHVSVLCTEVTTEGHRMRRLRDLPLVRDRSPVFLLSWAVMHEIDAESPLAGINHEEMLDDNIMVVCTLTGVDGTTGQAMTSRHVYHADEIEFGRVLIDVINTTSDGVVLDYASFHETRDESVEVSTEEKVLDSEVAAVDDVEGADDDTPES